MHVSNLDLHSSVYKHEVPEGLFECLLILGCLLGGILQPINNQPATTIPTTGVGYSTCSVHGGYTICVSHCMPVAGDMCYPALQGTHWGIPISFCLTCESFTMVAAVHLYNTLLVKNVFNIGNLYSMVVIWHKKQTKNLQFQKSTECLLMPWHLYGARTSANTLLTTINTQKCHSYSRSYWFGPNSSKMNGMPESDWKKHEKNFLFLLSNHAVKFSYDHASFGFLKKKMLLLTMFSWTYGMHDGSNELFIEDFISFYCTIKWHLAWQILWWWH